MPAKGYKLTAEQRARCSEGQKNSLVCQARLKELNARKVGKPLSEEWKNKVSASLKGRKLSEEHKLKLSQNKLGDKHYNWKGGKTPENERIRNSKEYREWRKAVYSRDNYTCRECGDSSGGNLNADHIMPFALYEDLRFEVYNGRTLCIPCHELTETFAGRIYSYMKI